MKPKVKMKTIHRKKRGSKLVFLPQLILTWVSPLVLDLPYLCICAVLS
jgi:hypothetical protein